MLDLQQVANWARLRARLQADKLKVSDRNFARAYKNLNAPFPDRLLEACRKSGGDPKAAPPSIFVALPERLFAKAAYICLADMRAGKNSDLPPESIGEAGISALRQYGDNCHKDTLFAHFDTPEKVASIRRVLLCHGLSPIGDSVLLLADVGRASRVSTALDIDVVVMLADASWTRYNRSVRRMRDMSDERLEQGLHTSLYRRNRLYKALGMTVQTHEIASTDRTGAISGTKLRKISDQYLHLAEALWGAGITSRPLRPDEVSNMQLPLEGLIARGEVACPDHLRTLGEFPGVVLGLESTLKSHLEILRTVARQFNSFDSDILMYFFAQYFAQDGYRANVLKVSPVSERAFDDPFDRLDAHFRAWGEGHSALSLPHPSDHQSRTPTMRAAYLPQYQMGAYRVLPYNPLSLDVMRMDEKLDEELLNARLLMLDKNMLGKMGELLRRNREVLAATPLVPRNRLIADLASFLCLCLRTTSAALVDNTLSGSGLPTLQVVLQAFHPDLPHLVETELTVSRTGGVGMLWESWLDNIGTEMAAPGIPAHIPFLLLTEVDWTDELLSRAGELVGAAEAVYWALVE